jgi:hypothetical protein
MVLGSTQPLTEMSTRNLPGGKGRPARGADNLIAVTRLSRKCGSLDVSEPYGPSWPVKGIAFFFTIFVSFFVVVHILWRSMCIDTDALAMHGCYL